MAHKVPFPSSTRADCNHGRYNVRAAMDASEFFRVPQCLPFSADSLNWSFSLDARKSRSRTKRGRRRDRMRNDRMCEGKNAQSCESRIDVGRISFWLSGPFTYVHYHSEALTDLPSVR